MNWSLRTNDYKRDQLHADILLCTKKDVVVLSLKKLALYWGLAVFCVFIPILHFVLVPIFLILGVLSFLSQHKLTHHLVQGQYTCPDCHNSFKIKNIYFSEGQKMNCELCQVQLVIERDQTDSK